jgi:hypothetical protein
LQGFVKQSWAHLKKIMPQLDQTLSCYRKETVWNRLFAPIDVAILAYFRIIFGVIMLVEIWRYFSHDWISSYYIEPTFHFTYYGFDWIQPWSGGGMYLHFYVLGALATCIILGVGYRISAPLFFLGFTYVFLLDQTNYLNHFYLISLISLLMIFVPAHRTLSIDALLRPKIHAETAPAWTFWMLRAQIGIVYFYGGLAKLNADWLHGEPLRMWLAGRTDFPVIGSLFTEEWMILLFNYGALLFDLLIAPLLLWKRTRWPALGVAVTFHVLNSQLFDIGIFPWLMIAATLLFLPSHWPRQIFNFMLRRSEDNKKESQRYGITHLKRIQKITITLLMIYFVVQLSVPLRHHFYPGDVNWTEEGHLFSWHMKLRDKEVAEAVFYVTDPASGKSWSIDPNDELTSRQANKMAARPDMILQYSHHIADELRKQGYDEIEVRAWIMVSLNDREPQLLIDPTVDLATQPRTLLSATWIMPLED